MSVFRNIRETYYKWKRDYKAKGESALINSKPCPQNPKLRIAADIEEKILHLRRTYYLGQLRISWYLQRYHGIKVSPAGIWCVLKLNGLNRLPQNQRKRSMEQFKRYEKQVIPGRSKLSFVIVLSKFTLADNKRLFVEFFERDGERNFSLKSNTVNYCAPEVYDLGPTHVFIMRLREMRQSGRPFSTHGCTNILPE